MRRDEDKRHRAIGMPGVDRAVRIVPLFHRAVIGSDQRGDAHFLCHLDCAPQLRIDRRHGTHDRLAVFAVTDHVDVGPIDDHKVECRVA